MSQRSFFFRIVSVFGMLLLLLSLTLSVMAEDALEAGQELLKNGDFSGTLNFGLYMESGGHAVLDIADGELLIDVSRVGTVSHAIQPFYDGFKLVQGVEYQLSFDAHSTLPRDLFVRIQLNGGDYHAYFEELISLTEEVQHFSFPFEMKEKTDPSPRLCVNMGYVDTMKDAGLASDDIAPHQVWFDNFSLIILDASGEVKLDADRINPIRVNQVGYLPDSRKTAVLADIDADSFKIVKLNNGESVFEGILSEPVENPYSGEVNRVADFSEFSKQGYYKLVASDGTESPTLTISKSAYNKLLHNALHMLYLQRCGSELGEDHAGIYAHPVCHSEPALIYGTDQYIDVSGGWHDAGDYGRYVVPGAKAAADLLLSYEMNEKLIDDADIPESGDGIDDRLQEVRYELDWMLKMQREDGGVYHKVSGRNFPGFVKPEEEMAELVVSPVSNTATGDFAAVMALAARIYSESGSPELAEAAGIYLAAAERAWAYLNEHMDDPGFTNPSDIVTGEYPDDKAVDERFWAAAELAKMTGKDEYREAAAEMLASGGVTSELGWVEMGGYGLYAILSDPQLDPENETYKLALEKLSSAVDKMSSVIGSHPYAINRTDSFEWGSNMGVANDGIVLLWGAEILEDESLRVDAARQLDYLLGENATGYSFVTGMGTKSPENPHHRPSTAFGAAVPGMLVGGPDNALEDPYAQNVLADCIAANCYADSDQSYSTNEVAIYWNSPLILLVSGLLPN